MVGDGEKLFRAFVELMEARALDADHEMSPEAAEAVRRIASDARFVLTQHDASKREG
ncbi:MAG: hypothetical protein AAGL89_14230 [Pseudomonadota bacterium]